MPTQTLTRYPLAPMQRSFLFELLGRGHDGTNIEQIVCRLGRPVDKTLLEGALRLVHMRHEALRTRFVEKAGVPTEQAVLQDPPVRLERRALQRLEELEEFLEHDRAQPFAPFEAPPLRWTLLELEQEHPILICTFHHVLLDGRAFPIVLQDLWRAEDALRDGAPSESLGHPAPSPGPLYRWHTSRSRSLDIEFWATQLRGFGGKPKFPRQLASTGAVEQPERIRGHLWAELDEAASEVLRGAAQALEVSVANFVQAAWAIVYGRYTLDDDVLFGTARAGRHGPIDASTGAVALAMNMVPIRADVSAARSAKALLQNLRAYNLSLRGYDHTPLLDVARAAGLDSVEAPFDTAIVFDSESLNARMNRLEPGRSERYEVREQTSFPLTLYGYNDRTMKLELGYDRDRVGDRAAKTLFEQVQTVLLHLAENPEAPLSSLRLSSDEELACLKSSFGAAPRAVESESVLADILRQLETRSDRVTLRYRDQTLTGAEALHVSECVAHALREAGVRRGDLVGVYRRPDVFLPCVLIGIWRAGGAYVPLDPSYPEHRISFKLQDTALRYIVAQSATARALPPHGAQVLAIDDPLHQGSPMTFSPDEVCRGEDLAYMIYTSGSTGKPKGTLVEHRQVANLFAGLDDVIPREKDSPPVWLAVTSLSFDISVVELLYTLARGFEVVIHDERDDYVQLSRAEPASPRTEALHLSLMFFGAAGSTTSSSMDHYAFVVEAARRADREGLLAVWTPERHFHAFGAPYPSPAVLGAALAQATERVRIRAGSVVMPLHHPARVAEDWSVVDNLSGGRVGISFASGWHIRDFLLRPEGHEERKRLTFDGLETVRRLWRGEELIFKGPGGEHPIRTLPRPVQPELPTWVTAAGNPETFEAAGRLGANLLTHLLGQSFEEVAPKIERYRAARKASGHVGRGTLTLMLHTFIGEEREAIKALVRAPMKAYLRTALGLVGENAFDFPVVAQRVRAGAEIDAVLRDLSSEELDALHEHAFERYFERSGLFGTVEEAAAICDRAQSIGVDEVACLVDFGVPAEQVLEGIARLGQLHRSLNAEPELSPSDYSLPALVKRHRVTHLQCTPSRAKILTLDPSTRAALSSLSHLFVGGEALAVDLARELKALVRSTVTNMYGPTETTVWSTTHRVRGDERSMPIGRPIVNTDIRVVDEQGRLCPVGVVGELWIGGRGVARGYYRRDALTQERFDRDPFSDRPDNRIYRTGDLAVWKADGTLEFLGRIDQQVKIRGYRIEVGEIEAVLREHTEVQGAVVTPYKDPTNDVVQLIAYVVPRAGGTAEESALRAHLRTRLPAYMMPSRFVPMFALPLLPNGKLDRQSLPPPSAERVADAPKPEPTGGAGHRQDPRRPTDGIEEEIRALWKDVLGVQNVGRSDSFFDLGGHSLLVVQVHGRLRERYPSVGITELFRFPTVASLAGYLATQASQTPSSQEGPLSESRAQSRLASLTKRRAQRRARA